MAAGEPGGGSRRLAELIEEHGGAIEAELRRQFGIRLTDVYRGREHPAEVLRLLIWTPDTGEFAASLRGGREWLGWGVDRQLAKWTADVSAAHAMSGSKKKPPVFPAPAPKRQSR